MDEPQDFGFLTASFRFFFDAIDEFPSRFFLGRRASLKLPRDERARARFAQARAVKVDLYVCTWLLLELAGLLVSIHLQSLNKWVSLIMTGIYAMRILEICAASANIALFHAAKNPAVASLLRILILTVLNTLELWLCFASIYATHSQLLSTHSAGDALYFSGVTQLTIGYGDIVPSGWLRGVALLQGWLGTMFALLILGRIVGLIPSLRYMSDPLARQDERFEDEPEKVLTPSGGRTSSEPDQLDRSKHGST